MASFNEQLARMQGLMNYGMVTESEVKPSKSIEYQEIGADGKSYAIIKENSHYVIKKAPADKSTVLESYEYLDGWNHLDKHEYHSYNEAKKQFGFKMSSLNEAFNYNVNKDDVSSYANMQLMTEGSEKMMNEIARQKQIMFNAAAILKEESSISKTNTGNPEAPKQGCGKAANCGEPFGEKAEATLDKDPKNASGKPESMGDPYGDGEKAKEMKDAEYVPAGSVANQKPKGGKVVKVNESSDIEAVAANAAEEAANSDVNEADEKTFNAGLPGGAGVGSPAKTKKHIMEDDELGDEDGEDIDLGGEDEADGEDIELGGDDDIDGEDIDLGDEGSEGEDDIDIDGESEEDELGGGDEEETIEDLKAQIEELESRIASLEAGEEGEEMPEDEDELELGDDDEDLDTEELGDEDIDDDSEEFDEEPDDDEPIDLTNDEDAEDFMEGVIRNVSSTILAEQTKSKYMNNIVNDVVNSILSEGKRSVKEERTELHDFGKHPGYRKKPMTLPETGSDEFNGRRDWNDDSVHNEQPFGQGKGKSDPYGKEALVKSITNDIMEQLKKKA